MYERFTDQARKVMQLANQEAQRFNHDHIAPEHILCGLVKEGSGVAAHVLKNLKVDLRTLRLETEKRLTSGPEMVTMGKLPQTPAAKNVVDCAVSCAEKLQHNYVGTEHLLLGCLHSTSLAPVFEAVGLTLPMVQHEILRLNGEEAPVSDEIKKSLRVVWHRMAEALVAEPQYNPYFCPIACVDPGKASEEILTVLRLLAEYACLELGITGRYPTTAEVRDLLSGKVGELFRAKMTAQSSEPCSDPKPPSQDQSVQDESAPTPPVNPFHDGKQDW